MPRIASAIWPECEAQTTLVQPCESVRKTAARLSFWTQLFKNSSAIPVALVNGRPAAVAFDFLPATLPAMPTLVERFLQAFIPLFVAIDPIGLVAIFLALGQGVPPAQRRRIANQAAWTGGGVALLFLFLGQSIFAAVGITVSDFQIAGGLILFILAARDLVHSAVDEPMKLADDFGVVPLGMPLIAGPASITTLIVLAQTATIGFVMALAALVANLALIVLAFAYSQQLARLIGATGLRAISKIVSMLLAAIAVNMIRKGWAG